MTDAPMYNVASAVFCRSLAIVRSLSLPECVLSFAKRTNRAASVSGDVSSNLLS